VSKSTKQTSPAIRARCTWHLHPPFDRTFDRSRWWTGPDAPKEIDPDAALYELVRRHPRVGQALLSEHQNGAVGENRLSDVFQNSRKLFWRQTKQPARCPKWLERIGGFERGMSSPEQYKTAQDLKHYSETMELIRFSPYREPTPCG
jgi:hypothetical protein